MAGLGPNQLAALGARWVFGGRASKWGSVPWEAPGLGAATNIYYSGPASQAPPGLSALGIWGQEESSRGVGHGQSSPFVAILPTIYFLLSLALSFLSHKMGKGIPYPTNLAG